MDAETLDAALERSLDRVARRMPADSPLVGRDGRPLCPWCGSALVVRFSHIARAGPDPLDVGDGTRDEADPDRTPYIDGVGLKCAGRGGCGFRPDYDVGLARGFWPDLSAAAERDAELDRRGGAEFARLDAAYGRQDRTVESVDVEARLHDLGYL